MVLLYFITITILLIPYINAAPECCTVCCGKNSSSKSDNDLQTSGISSPGPNIRPTVYPPSRVEYCDDDPEESPQLLADLGGAISGARSPFSGKSGPRVGKRPGGGGGFKKPGPMRGKGKPKPPRPPPLPPLPHPVGPPPTGGGQRTGWDKAGTVFDGINAATGIGKLTLDTVSMAQNTAGGIYEEGGEAQAENA